VAAEEIDEIVENKVPSQLRSCCFVLEKRGTKRPLHPWKPGDSDAEHYSFNDPRLQGHVVNGGNLAVVLNHGLIVVDVDEASEVGPIIEALPDTFTVSTRRGTHLYFECHDWIEHNEEIPGVGEILGPGHLVSIPPSIHPSGHRYVVENNLPIAETCCKDLRQQLASFGLETLEEKREREARKEFEKWARDMERKKKAQTVTGGSGDLPEPEEVESRMPSIAVFFGGEEGKRTAHPVHGSDTGRNFLVNAGGETARCWRHNKTAGKLYWYAVLRNVISCGDAAPTGKEFVEQVWKPAAAEFLEIES